MVTTRKPKFKKHPSTMNSFELAEAVFHPKVLKAARKHVENSEVAKKPRKAR
jgi:hypothetical protein